MFDMDPNAIDRSCWNKRMDSRSPDAVLTIGWILVDIGLIPFVTGPSESQQEVELLHPDRQYA